MNRRTVGISREATLGGPVKRLTIWPRRHNAIMAVQSSPP
jgi:hypothetical protein